MPRTLKQKTDDQKRIAELEELLHMTKFVALRVWNKYGHTEDGEPYDWDEWTNLKTQCDKIETAIGKGWSS